jgi:hypothetical protein
VRDLAPVANGTVVITQADSQVRMFSGSAWSGLTTGRNTITGVWGTSSTDIWLISSGNADEVRPIHWDSSAWTEHPFPNQGGKYFTNAIWGSAPDDYWIAGSRRLADSTTERLLFHWNGADWIVAGTYGSWDGINQSPFYFDSIHGTGADDVYVAGVDMTLHRDATGWSPLVLPDNASAGGRLLGSSTSDVYLLTPGLLWHWDGAVWKKTSVSSSVTSGWGNSPTDIWLRSSNSLTHYDDMFFIDVPTSPPPSTPFGKATEMWLARPGTKWPTGFGSTPTESRIPFEPSSVWVAPDGKIYAAGQGLIVH